ncbi:unnamed protein product [Ilex paraguariensis]
MGAYRYNRMSFGAEKVKSSSSGVRPSERRKRRSNKVFKNREEIENQRMTHIAVERNRRRQMNHYLSGLRSLMPPSYSQRGDQASIVGGAINFVKELEQLLQILEAHKQIKQQSNTCNSSLFANFFTFPQYSTCPTGHNSVVATESMADKWSPVADIEVNIVENHANIKVLSRRRPKQLLKMVNGFHSINLTLMHLNISTVENMVLYSFSVKVEDDCHLTTVNEIATAVHEMVAMIQPEQTDKKSQDNQSEQVQKPRVATRTINNQKLNSKGLEGGEISMGLMLSPKSGIELMQNCDLPPPLKVFSGPDKKVIPPMNSLIGQEEEAVAFPMSRSGSEGENLELLRALRLSQTRAREAERKAQVLVKERDTLSNGLIKESAQLFAYRQWVKLLEVQVSVLQWQQQQQKLFGSCYEDSTEEDDANEEGKGRMRWFVALAFCLGIAGFGLMFNWRYLF